MYSSSAHAIFGVFIAIFEFLGTRRFDCCSLKSMILNHPQNHTQKKRLQDHGRCENALAEFLDNNSKEDTAANDSD